MDQILTTEEGQLNIEYLKLQKANDELNKQIVFVMNKNVQLELSQSQTWLHERLVKSEELMTTLQEHAALSRQAYHKLKLEKRKLQRDYKRLNSHRLNLEDEIESLNDEIERLKKALSIEKEVSAGALIANKMNFNITESVDDSMNALLNNQLAETAKLKNAIREIYNDVYFEELELDTNDFKLRIKKIFESKCNELEIDLEKQSESR